MNQKKTGVRIRHLREKKAWTQEYLSIAADLSVRTIQRAEEGTFAAKTLSAIAGALNAKIEDLTKTLVATQPISPITPILYYAKIATLDWLVKAFGFEITERHTSPDGQIMQAELNVGGGTIMCGSPTPSAGMKTPKTLKGVNQCLNVVVDDVDAHFKRAKKIRAEILNTLQNGYGYRRYQARDPEGHIWYFATPLETE